jgi:hypothetical protein
VNLETKLYVLDQIYAIYENFVDGVSIACRKYCSQCCTGNVTLTTLEAYKFVDHVLSRRQSHLLDKLDAALQKKRFQPQATLNELASLCIEGKEIPEEESDSLCESCPFLTDRQCPIYQVRPFGCRCFISKHNCRDLGYAMVPPHVLTVNNIFLQYIEHVDCPGFCGNMADVLKWMASPENRDAYRLNILQNPRPGLLQNWPIRALMIPQEDRLRVKPILEALQAIQVPRRQVR